MQILHITKLMFYLFTDWKMDCLAHLKHSAIELFKNRKMSLKLLGTSMFIWLFDEYYTIKFKQKIMKQPWPSVKINQ